MNVELVELLAKRFPESSRTTLRGMIASKRVLVDGVIARTLKQQVDAGARVEILGRVEARQRVAPTLPFRVVFEDRDLLVIDKPAGLITSSGENDKRSTVTDILAAHYEAIDSRLELGLIHRLDKDASGLLVFSKTPAAFESLKQQFAEKTARRIYRAIVTGAPRTPSGTIESKLVELADGTVKSTRHRDYGDVAVTHYSTLDARGGHTMLRVALETGRKHQIRVHLAEQGAPIAGDVLYHPRPRPTPRLMLVAAELVVRHPRTGDEIKWTIDLPRDVLDWWESAT